MHPTNCLNCETMLTADDHYCPTCGQKTDTHRLTIQHIFHEFFHAFTHADKGFLGMLADLLLKPGTVAREYVKGKRKKYFSPFTFFILSIGVLVFSSHYFKTFEEHHKADPHVLAQLSGNEAAKKQYLRIIERANNTTDFVGHHMNTIAMLVVPFYAFVGWIFFRRRGYNYSEILVAYILFQSVISLFMAAAIVPWLMKFKDQPFFYYGYGVFLLLSSLYVGIGLYHFLGFKKRWSIILTTLVVLLAYLIYLVIMILAILYYLLGSKTWELITITWQKYIG
jgi:hypothetical protein